MMSLKVFPKEPNSENIKILNFTYLSLKKSQSATFPCISKLQFCHISSYWTSRFCEGYIQRIKCGCLKFGISYFFFYGAKKENKLQSKICFIRRKCFHEKKIRKMSFLPLVASVNYLVYEKCYLSSLSEQITLKQNVKMSNICPWLPFKEH